ncbi:MAG: ankyrin repeat domain-containing protein [Spirochaetota bacterium]
MQTKSKLRKLFITLTLMMTTFSIHVKANKRDDKGRTALHLAALSCDKKAIQKLIQSGAKINLKDDSDRTPLHLAASACGEKVIRILLAAGAKVNDRMSYHQSPLHDAVTSNNVIAIKTLLLLGASIKTKLVSIRTTKFELGDCKKMQNL